MPSVTAPAHQKGDFLVDYESKVFEDVKAEKVRKRWSLFTRWPSRDRSVWSTCCRPPDCSAKGLRHRSCLYGPGVTLGVQRGFPTLGDEAFPGHLNMNKQLVKFMEEGGKVYACRFALQRCTGTASHP